MQAHSEKIPKFIEEFLKFHKNDFQIDFIMPLMQAHLEIL